MLFAFKDANKGLKHRIKRIVELIGGEKRIFR